MKVEIANRLYEYRKATGMSQEKVASLLGVSRQAVSKWECAESSPDTDNLIALAQLYGVSVDELLFADPEVEEAPCADTSTPEFEETVVEVEGEPVDEGAKDYARINLFDGVHVRDSKNGEEVHVDWDGIHIDSGNDHIHIDFANFKSIAQAIRAARKELERDE